MIFWQSSLVDTFNIFKLCVNCGSQYMFIVVALSDENFSHISSKLLLEPVLEPGTANQFVKTASVAFEVRQYISTLISFLVTSTVTINTNLATNLAFRASMDRKISYMKTVFVTRREGSKLILNPLLKYFTIVVNSIKTPIVHPHRAQFTANCGININNIFQKYMTSRHI